MRESYNLVMRTRNPARLTISNLRCSRRDYAVTVTHGRATDSSVLNVFIARIA